MQYALRFCTSPWIVLKNDANGANCRLLALGAIEEPSRSVFLASTKRIARIDTLTRCIKTRSGRSRTRKTRKIPVPINAPSTTIINDHF
ncbi:MAG TPA: hypothetical protein K8W01_08825 [Methylorubrum populi]|uniref:Uncharacterized protein n=1 Tax=Methylorubrum populi TaxID=223967 RepID=A0A921E2G0_9HYPH|nr:hypothetical protein [Methylorubrum populi]